MKLSEMPLLGVGSQVLYRNRKFRVQGIGPATANDGFPTLCLVPNSGGGENISMSAKFVNLEKPPQIADAATILHQVGQECQNCVEERNKLVAQREQIDARIKFLDSWSKGVTETLQAATNRLGLRLGLEPQGVPQDPPQEDATTGETGRALVYALRLRQGVVKRFAGKDLCACAKTVLSEHQKLSVWKLAKRIKAGGYKGRKPTTLVRLRHSLCSLLSKESCFKRVAWGIYALAK